MVQLDISSVWSTKVTRPVFTILQKTQKKLLNWSCKLSAIKISFFFCDAYAKYLRQLFVINDQ